MPVTIAWNAGLKKSVSRPARIANSSGRAVWGPSCRSASIEAMSEEQRLRTHTPESRRFAERVQIVMDLTSRLNVLSFNDIAARNALLGEILGRPLPATVTIYPPFYSDYGLGIEFGERVFVNQGCYLLDFGGISIGDR